MCVLGPSALPSDVLHIKVQLQFKLYVSFTHLQCTSPQPISRSDAYSSAVPLAQSFPGKWFTSGSSLPLAEPMGRAARPSADLVGAQRGPGAHTRHRGLLAAS